MSGVDSPMARADARRRIVVGAGVVGMLLVVLVTTILLLPTTHDDDGAHVLRPKGGPVVLVAEKTDSGSDALLRGEVVDVDGCLGVRTADREMSLVVWPHGTTVEPDPYRVVLAGRSYRMGDTVALGGGFGGSLERGDALHRETPQTCRGRAVFRSWS